MAPTRIKHTVIPGGLSDADRERIHALAGRKPTRIAQMIGKHPSTVRFYMYRRGLIAPTGTRQAAYTRNGVAVKPFSPAEDARMTALRIDGASSPAIAARLAAEFGHVRSPHTIRIRLAMLAAREAADDARSSPRSRAGDRSPPRPEASPPAPSFRPHHQAGETAARTKS